MSEVPLNLIASEASPLVLRRAGAGRPALSVGAGRPALSGRPAEREFFIDNLLVRIHLIIVMIRWTGLAPWEFEFPFPGTLHLPSFPEA